MNITTIDPPPTALYRFAKPCPAPHTSLFCTAPARALPQNPFPSLCAPLQRPSTDFTYPHSTPSSHGALQEADQGPDLPLTDHRRRPGRPGTRRSSRASSWPSCGAENRGPRRQPAPARPPAEGLSGLAWAMRWSTASVGWTLSSWLLCCALLRGCVRMLPGLHLRVRDASRALVNAFRRSVHRVCTACAWVAWRGAPVWHDVETFMRCEYHHYI